MIVLITLFLAGHVGNRILRDGDHGLRWLCSTGASRDDLSNGFAEIDFQPLVARDLEPARVEAELV
jgi:hypothetical protein